MLLGAAAGYFQSVAHGTFTPAGGIFATWTSIMIIGRLFWPVALFAAILAMTVAGIVWVAGVGR